MRFLPPTLQVGGKHHLICLRIHLNRCVNIDFWNFGYQFGNFTSIKDHELLRFLF